MSNKKIEAEENLCTNWYAQYQTFPSWVKNDLEKSNIMIDKESNLPISVIDTEEKLKEILGFSTFPKMSHKKILEQSNLYAFKYPNGAYRVKLETPIKTEKGTCRYLSPSFEGGDHPEPTLFFLQEQEKALKNRKNPIFFTEGEKKTISLQQAIDEEYGGVAVGFPGVSLNGRGIDQNKGLFGSFKGRKCYIAFDAGDYKENPDVQQQALKLWLDLYRRGAGEISFLIWENGKGIDDALANGENISDIIDSATPDPFDVFQILSSKNGQRFFVETIVSLKFNKKQYTALYGELDLGRRFPSLDKKEWEKTVGSFYAEKIKKEAPTTEELPILLRFNAIGIGEESSSSTHYKVTSGGVFKISITQEYIFATDKHITKESTIHICVDPIIVEKVLCDVFGNGASVLLSWGNNKKLFPMSALSTRGMDCLAASGIRINPSVQGLLLSEYFAASINRFSREEISPFASKNGWVDEKCEKFVLGNFLIEKEGTKSLVESPDQTGLKLGKQGDTKKWLECISPFWNDPLVQILFAASACSPLAEMLKIEPKIVHLYGNSSSTKSTAARIAASLWGQPKGRQEILSQWDGTTTGHEQYFAFMGNIPAFLDDSQSCKTEVIEHTIQSFVNCKGRTRGGIGQNGSVALAKSASWWAMMISTGERSLLDSSTTTGQVARVIQFLRKKTEHINQTHFQSLSLGLSENYGFGEELISFALKNKKSILKWFTESMGLLEDNFKNIPHEKARLLQSLALIMAGARLCYEVFGINFDSPAILGEFREVLKKEELQKGFEGAREYLLGKYQTNPGRFGFFNEGKYSPNSDLFGKEEWGVVSRDHNAICFHTNIIKQLLEEGRYSMSELTIMGSENLLITEQGQGNRLRLRILGERIRFYALKMDSSSDISAPSWVRGSAAAPTADPTADPAEIQ